MGDEQGAGWYPRSIRLRGYDYRSQGAYFVTLCTAGRLCTLHVEEVRSAVEDAWRKISAHFPQVRTDEFVVMLNHIHGIIWILKPDEDDDASQPASIRHREVGAQHAAPLRMETRQRPAVLPGSLGAIVRSFKSAATKRINEIRGTPGTPVWQRNYYERVIRNEAELNRVREYIHLNPLQWALDHENPHRTSDTAYDRQWAWIEGTDAKPGRVVGSRD